MNETEIQKLTRTFMDAYNRKDAIAACQVYAEDAKLMPPGTPIMNGCQAIMAFWMRAMDMGMALQLEVADLIVDGSVACERGIIIMTSQTKVVKGKYVTVVRRQQNGSWKIVLDIWNLDAP